MSIREFLLERIAEDELRANYYGPKAMGTARVLAECEAKRAVIEQHGPGEGHYRDYCETCAEWWAAEIGEGPPGVRFPCPTLRAVAAAYSNHPDYQQEWAIGQHP